MTPSAELGTGQPPEDEGEEQDVLPPIMPPKAVQLAPRVSAPSAPVAFHSFAEFIEQVTSPEALDQGRKMAEAYDMACRSLLGPNDVQQEGGKEFKKKSAWRKLGRFFFISVHRTRGPDGRWEHLPHDDVAHYVAEAEVEAVAPWGQRMPGFGACTTRERRFYVQGPPCPKCGGPMWDNRNRQGADHFGCKDKGGCGGRLREGEYDPAAIGLIPNPGARSKAEHDCLATAQTRAINRAISELIAAGEVSWDEVAGAEVPGSSPSPAHDGGGVPRGKGGGGQRGGQQRKSAGPSLLDLNEPIGWGQHAKLTWLRVIHLAPDWVEWAAGEECRKTTKPQKEQLRAALKKRDAEVAEANAGAGPEPGGGFEPPPPTQSNGPGPSLDSNPASGKHRAKTWRQLVVDEPDYVGKAIEAGWAGLKDAAGLRRLLQETLEAPQVFAQIVSECNATPLEVKAYALAHGKLPDDIGEWGPFDFVTAVEGLRRAKKGPGHVFAEAVARTRPAASPKEGRIPEDIRKAKEVVDALARYNLTAEADRITAAIEEARKTGAIEELEKAVDAGRSAVYARLQGSKGAQGGLGV